MEELVLSFFEKSLQKKRKKKEEKKEKRNCRNKKNTSKFGKKKIGINQYSYLISKQKPRDMYIKYMKL